MRAGRCGESEERKAAGGLKGEERGVGWGRGREGGDEMELLTGETERNQRGRKQGGEGRRGGNSQRSYKYRRERGAPLVAA